MFCPICESEYEAGVTLCPDDNTQLVEGLSPESGASDASEARFVLLHRLGSPPEAEMVNDILKKSGIRSVVKSGPDDALSALLSATADGALILVDERDYDRALEVYSAFFGDDTTPLTGGGDDEEEE